jgi:NADH:ubiquinone oxidoreductase subunit 6 (chain J)
MIGAEFLGMIMLIVYVGAGAVLFLFVVRMLKVAQQKNEGFNSRGRSSHIPVGLLVSIIIFFELIMVIGGWKYKPELVESTANGKKTDLTKTQPLGSGRNTD